MKKSLVFLLCFVICISSSGCSLMYDCELDAIDNFDVGYSEILDNAFLSSYNWDGSDKTKNIVIPDEYKGIPITELGGYCGRGVPCAFGINLPDAILNNLCSEANEWCFSDSYEDIESTKTIYLNFNLHISKNIKQFIEHNLDCFYEGAYFDGKDYHSKIFVVPLYNITCDEDNITFYAKDGKLYYRKDDALVADILYYDFDIAECVKEEE